MAEQNILDNLMDKSMLKILRTFLDNPAQQFYLRELAKKTRIPTTSTLRILRHLIKQEIIEESRIKRMTLYELAMNKETEFLAEILSTKKSALNAFIDLISKVPGIDQVLLHGKESPDRASILIIGHSVDAEKVQYAVLDVKQRFKFSILHLLIEPAQFEQMTAMGLYPGKKVLLYPR